MQRGGKRNRDVTHYMSGADLTAHGKIGPQAMVEAWLKKTAGDVYNEKVSTAKVAGKVTKSEDTAARALLAGIHRYHRYVSGTVHAYHRPNSSLIPCDTFYVGDSSEPTLRSARKSAASKSAPKNNPPLDYHTILGISRAWPLVMTADSDAMCELLAHNGITLPRPHGKVRSPSLFFENRRAKSPELSTPAAMYPTLYWARLSAVQDETCVPEQTYR